MHVSCNLIIITAHKPAILNQNNLNSQTDSAIKFNHISLPHLLQLALILFHIIQPYEITLRL